MYLQRVEGTVILWSSGDICFERQCGSSPLTASSYWTNGIYRFVTREKLKYFPSLGVTSCFISVVILMVFCTQ